MRTPLALAAADPPVRTRLQDLSSPVCGRMLGARVLWSAGREDSSREVLMKTISILTPCYNEEANVREVYERVREAMAALGGYKYEHVFIDNASRDNTV